MNEAVADIKDVQNQIVPIVVDPEVEEMFKAGVHLGHVKSKNHPAMQPYIFGVRNTISIIDLAKTKEKLAQALDFIKAISAKDGTILFVGTRPSAKKVILDVIPDMRMPYYVDRWIGGTLTNFKVIAKRIEQMEQLETERDNGGFEKYTKKERLLKNEEIEKLKKKFDGLRTLKRLPDAVCVVDIVQDMTAVLEADVMHIPVIALVDTNADANAVSYPIPSSDDSVSAISYMLNRMVEAMKEGKKDALGKKEEATN